jgi:hypothetical protein
MDVSENYSPTGPTALEDRVAKMLDLLERIMPVVEKLLKHPMLKRWIS